MRYKNMISTYRNYLNSIQQRICKLLKKEADNPHAEIVKTTDSDEKLFSFYRGFIKRGDLCFDIGANVGSRTDIFLEVGARVVCIEPQPDCVSILQQKYRSNNRVIVVPKGLAKEAGRMNLSLCGQANTLATFSEKWKTGRFSSYIWESTLNVEVTTLDELIREFGKPAYCKIDVEGFEFKVLQGLGSPLKLLSFEFTKEFLQDASLCIEYLQSLGKVAFNYALGDNLTNEPKFEFINWVSGETVLTELKSIDTAMLWGDIYALFK